MSAVNGVRLNPQTGRTPAIWLLSLSLAVCGRSAMAADAASLHPDAGQTRELRLRHAEHERTVLLHLPAQMKAGESVPLVIALHGLSMDGASMELITGFSDVADERHFAVAYPDGLNRMWRFWERHELGARVRGEAGYVDDVGFIAALIDRLVGQGTVDADRVYVTGISNGAYMTNRLACSLADRIAAVAPVAGTMSRALAAVDPPRPVPVLYIHGSDDGIVGIDGVDGITRRKSSLAAEELVRWWADRNACHGEATIETLADVADDGCRVVRHEHASQRGAPVVYYEITGGGHTWPDGRRQPERLLGPVCRDFSACRVMWEFFTQHALPERAQSE